MALFINGVGQDTFSMNGVSIDNLYVDGVLVWSHNIEELGIPRYELTEALVDSSTVDDSANTLPDYNGLLTESDGTTPYEPTVTDYPQDGTLTLTGGRQIDTQFVFDHNFTGGAYGIYDVVPGTSYKIWATEPGTGYITVGLYEGDQDTPIVKTGDVATSLIGGETCIITEGRPAWLPENGTPYTVIPGLYSFGTDTRAAYGGAVDPIILHVDTLVEGISNTDSTHGSFEWCLTQTYPRVVVFDVSGIIDGRGQTSGGPIYIDNPYITIAGQTAPDSVIFNGSGITVRTHDVVIQHLAIRSKAGADLLDAFLAETSTAPIYNVILDHCSITQAADEPVDFWWNTNDLYDCTVSNCIMGKVLDAHPTGQMSYGSTSMAWVKNLITTYQFRGPMVTLPQTVVVYNNLIFNWRQSLLLIDGQFGGDGSVYYSGNHAVDGDYTTTVETANQLVTVNSDVEPTSEVSIYMADNIKINEEYVAAHDVNDMPGNGYTTLPSPLDNNGYTIEAASTTYDNVMAKVGPRPASRDTVDTEIIAEVVAQTGGVPYLTAPAVPAETEITLAFVPVANPHDMYDVNYTNFEKQLHDLAVSVE